MSSVKKARNSSVKKARHLKVEVRLNEAEMKLLDKKAAKYGLSRAEFIRFYVLREEGRKI